MVAEMINRRWRIHPMEVVCATVVAACLSTAAWFTLLQDDDSGVEITRLDRAIDQHHKELAALRKERERERVRLYDRERRLKESGVLPREAPVEQYLQTLSEFAKRHRLDVIRQSPLPSQTYPGLMERRYAYEVSGDMADIMRFFIALEETSYWADIGFLKITANDIASTRPATRVASLTISVFSAPPTEAKSDEG